MTDVRVDDRDPTFATPEPPTTAWVWQAASGVALLVLLTVHMVAQHFVVENGLRTYAQIVEYLRSPVILVIEHLFLVTVTLHAMLGIRAVLLDLGPAPAAQRRITRWLTGLGVVTVGYGVWLLWTVAGG